MIEEDQGIERLVLCRGSDLAVHGQMAEELEDLLSTHFRGMTLAMVEDEPANPANAGILCLRAVVLQANRFTNLIQQPRLGRCNLR